MHSGCNNYYQATESDLNSFLHFLYFSSTSNKSSCNCCLVLSSLAVLVSDFVNFSRSSFNNAFSYNIIINYQWAVSMTKECIIIYSLIIPEIVNRGVNRSL